MNEVKEAVKTAEYNDEFFEWEERDESISYINHCIAGSLAGVFEHVLLLPFDSIKTHMQVHEGRYGAFATAKDLYQTEGFLKFWRGASVLASGCAPAHAAYFSVYEFFKRKLLPKFHDQKDEIFPYAYALTGMLATVVHDFIITPFDTLKQRKQIAPQHLNKTAALIKYITKTEGPFALYRGFPITLLMNIPQAAVIVSMNETLKIMYRPKEGHNFLTYLICAATAGSVAAAATIPFDNIKTRLQTQTFYEDSRRDQETIKILKAANNTNVSSSAAESAPTSETKIKYQDILSTMRMIMKEEGIRGFTKGMLPRIIAHAPSSAISWTAYEMIKKLLNRRSIY